MTEDDAVERLKACKDIAEYLAQGNTVDNLSIDQLGQLELVEDVLDAGILPDQGMMKKAGLSPDQFNALIPSSRLASMLKKMKELNPDKS